MDWLKLHKKIKSNPLGVAFLWICSLFYRLAVFARRCFYDMGFLKNHTVNSRVVCLGNITTGGTGKTTAVMHAAQTLAKANIRVAIVSRGYKRDMPGDEVVVMQEGVETPWTKAGDEPYMMFEALEHKIPVIISANRYKAAQAAVKNFRSQVVLLDDGFQHYGLDRDMDIVLIDARNPFGGNALLPLGSLREPKGALKRAGLIMITHSDLVDPDRIEEIKETIKLYTKVPVIESVHKPEYYFDICKTQKVPLSDLKGNAVVFSAIGEPESFEQTLEHLGLRLMQRWRYPDHHPYTLEELRSISNLRNGLPVITTYKDLTRFPQGWQQILTENVYVLSIHLKITGGHDSKEIWADSLYPKLHTKLHGD